MYDREIVLEILRLILFATERIQRKMSLVSALRIFFQVKKNETSSTFYVCS